MESRRVEAIEAELDRRLGGPVKTKTLSVAEIKVVRDEVEADLDRKQRSCSRWLAECGRSKDRMWAFTDYVNAKDFRTGAQQFMQLCGVRPCVAHQRTPCGVAPRGALWCVVVSQKYKTRLGWSESGVWCFVFGVGWAIATKHAFGRPAATRQDVGRRGGATYRPRIFLDRRRIADADERGVGAVGRPRHQLLGTPAPTTPQARPGRVVGHGRRGVFTPRATLAYAGAVLEARRRRLWRQDSVRLFVRP